MHAFIPNKPQSLPAMVLPCLAVNEWTWTMKLHSVGVSVSDKRYPITHTRTIGLISSSPRKCVGGRISERVAGWVRIFLVNHNLQLYTGQNRTAHRAYITVHPPIRAAGWFGHISQTQIQLTYCNPMQPSSRISSSVTQHHEIISNQAKIDLRSGQVFFFYLKRKKYHEMKVKKSCSCIRVDRDHSLL